LGEFAQDDDRARDRGGFIEQFVNICGGSNGRVLTIDEADEWCDQLDAFFPR
jgi:hypothetical protein